MESQICRAHGADTSAPSPDLGTITTTTYLGLLAGANDANTDVACNPKYVVVVMVPKSGEGADVSAPCARQIWDSIYGLEGHKAAFPNGRAPAKLPVISASGAVTAPAGYKGAR